MPGNGALNALTPKQRKFVIEYAKCGNATKAATAAGYGKARQEGSRLLTKAVICDALATLTEPSENADIASAEERRRFWTAVLRGDEKAEMRDRLKAAELLGRASGDFIERREVSNPDGSLRPIVIEVVAGGPRTD